MSSDDWRSPGRYEHLQSLDAPGFAWEYLCRNPDFARERANLERAARHGPLRVAALEGFSQRWGVRFCKHGDSASSSSVVWTPLALPSVIVLTALPRDLANPDFGLAPAMLDTLLRAANKDGLIERPGTILRVQADPAGILPPAILLPLDRLFEIRVAAAVHLFRALTGRNSGPNPASLSPTRRGRLILALRGLDGRLAGATHREIARALFGDDAIAHRDWISHELRDQTARLVRLGFTMMRGGYRRLLLHPYRRKLPL